MILIIFRITTRSQEFFFQLFSSVKLSYRIFQRFFLFFDVRAEYDIVTVTIVT